MIPFNVKTHYSLQQAFTQIKPLVNRAKELELKALCITDYNTLSGCVEFFQECRKVNIKPILGVTLMTEFGELIILASNKDGWLDLIKLVNRIDKEGMTSWENLEEYSENLIAVCNKKFHFDLFANDLKKFKFKQVLAYEMVYENYPYIEGNQILYVHEDEKLYQEIVTCSRLKITLDELDHEEYNFSDNYLYYDEKFDSSDILNNMCEDYEIMNNPQYPDFDVDDPDEYITQLCRDGWKRKLIDKVKNSPELKQVYTDRIKYELEVFRDAGLSNYMLIIRDIIMYARQKNISVGLRGSASGCLISYLIDISNIDPVIPDPTLPYDSHKSLSFDRFFNKGRLNFGKISFSELSYEDFVNNHLCQNTI